MEKSARSTSTKTERKFFSNVHSKTCIGFRVLGFAFWDFGIRQGGRAKEAGGSHASSRGDRDRDRDKQTDR